MEFRRAGRFMGPFSAGGGEAAGLWELGCRGLVVGQWTAADRNDGTCWYRLHVDAGENGEMLELRRVDIQ